MSYEQVEVIRNQVDDALEKATWSVIEEVPPETEFYQGISGDWSFVVGAQDDRVRCMATHQGQTTLLTARQQADRALELARAQVPKQ